MWVRLWSSVILNMYFTHMIGSSQMLPCCSNLFLHLLFYYLIDSESSQRPWRKKTHKDKYKKSQYLTIKEVKDDCKWKQSVTLFKKIPFVSVPLMATGVYGSDQSGYTTRHSTTVTGQYFYVVEMCLINHKSCFFFNKHNLNTEMQMKPKN